MYKRLILLFVLLLFIVSCAYAVEQKAQQESDQQINEFSLAGYGEKGKKTWDISGETADIFEETIKLNNIISNLYGDKEDIKLTADKGDFNKNDGKVHVEQNVVVTTSSGSKLTTDSLNWDRKKQLVTTDDKVNITRDNMVAVGRGVVGEMNLNKVTLEKEVQVDINPKASDGKKADEKNKIVITCDGPLEVDYAKNIATFKNNVLVDTQDNLIYSDIMDVYFLSGNKEETQASSSETAPNMMMGAKIDKIIARGNVKIVRGENVSYSDEAVYSSADKKIVLTGKPKLIIYSTEALSASSGN